MANELQLYTDPALCTGETIIAKLFENGAQVSTDIPMTEVAASGHFNGDMPVVAAATYAVMFYDSSADIVGTGRIVWDGTSEIDPSSLAAAIDTRSSHTVADILDGVIEGTLSLKSVLRIVFAVVAGKTSGGGTATAHIRDIADTKDRVLATVDSSGNRTAVTIDES